jgi:hypothetical protein
MDYQIISANSATGQIEVLYKDNGQSVGVYAIDVPIVNGEFITGQTLHNEIMHRAPLWVSQRDQEVKTAVGFDQIVALVQPLVIDQTVSEQQANAQMWAQVEFEKQVAKALVKFGVLQSDPTKIEVTHL